MLLFIHHKHCQNSCPVHEIDYSSTLFVTGKNHFFSVQKTFMTKGKGNMAICISSKTKRESNVHWHVMIKITIIFFIIMASN